VLKTIFTAIFHGWSSAHPQDIRDLGGRVVSATTETFNRVRDTMRPTPSKSHYTFNLRDVSKVFQGVLMIGVKELGGSPDLLARLWCHECMRVFHDRLTDTKDKNAFTAMMEDALSITPIKNYKDLLPEGYQCVSVVVQHKENRVVCPVFLPKLYIVSMTKVETDGLVMSYAAADMPESHRIYAVPSYDVGALGMPAATAESVDNWIAMKALTLKQGWQGVVLYDGAGGRTKKRTTFYNDAKELRGNDRCMEERYARLRKARKIKKYIQLYAEDEDKFFVLEERLRAHTKSLYDYYIKTNITKTQPYDELPWPYKYHVAALHRRYKEYEKPAGGKISLPYVITYVNALDVEDAANIMKGSTADQIAATAVAQVQAEAE
jgi:hypothetical protein